MRLDRDGKAADERPHVLDRVESRGNAENDGVLLHLHPDGAEIRFPAELRRDGRKVDAVIDGEHRLRVKAAGDQQLRHGVRHADVIVKHTQRNGIDRAVGQPVQGSAQIVQTIVGMNGRDDRDADLPPQDRACQICARAVAVDDLKALRTDHLRKAADGRADRILHHERVDAELPCVLGKFSFAEADEADLLHLSKTVQQRQHMRFRAADVAA